MTQMYDKRADVCKVETMQPVGYKVSAICGGRVETSAGKMAEGGGGPTEEGRASEALVWLAGSGMQALVTSGSGTNHSTSMTRAHVQAATF